MLLKININWFKLKYLLKGIEVNTASPQKTEKREVVIKHLVWEMSIEEIESLAVAANRGKIFVIALTIWFRARSWSKLWGKQYQLFYNTCGFIFDFDGEGSMQKCFSRDLYSP